MRDNLFKEAAKLLSAAEETCGNLESAMIPDNQVQTKIVNNRRLEIHWLHDEIQQGLTEKTTKTVKRRKAKSKTSYLQRSQTVAPATSPVEDEVTAIKQSTFKAGRLYSIDPNPR